MNESEAFKLLASVDRQLLLHELVRTDGSVTEEELSLRVAARRHQLSFADISEKQVERAHLRLIHEHLPLLLDTNVVEWDEGTVVLTGECTGQLLDAAEALESWPPDDRLQHRTP